MRAGDVVALIGDNRPDWVAGEIAAHAVGAMSLGIYRDALDEEVAHLLVAGDVTVVFAEDEEQVDKLLERRRPRSSVCATSSIRTRAACENMPIRG